MRIADYIFKTLADHGAKHVFLVTGGGAMHLNDALRCEKRLTAICCHHEQGCAIAAEGYFRAGGKIGVVSVTSGPGGTNALTGVLGQWLDSIPVVYISGQVKYETTISSCPELKLRQLGDQEINIIDVVRPITKYATMITDANKIREELEKALYIATTGRPGPVWLDIPLNIQATQIDENNLSGFVLSESVTVEDLQIKTVYDLLNKAKRPVIIGGFGIKLANARNKFIKLAEQLQVPVVSTFNGIDLIPSDHCLFSGRIGTLGQRAGNFVLQNADLILSIGSRNNIRQVSYEWKNFARKAVKISVDIDQEELKKKTFVPDFAICSDAGRFIEELALFAKNKPLTDHSFWLNWCRERMKTNNPHTDEQCNHTEKVNPYHFMYELTSLINSAVNVVAGNGTACVALFQTGIVKENQNIFWNSGCASMGYDVPASIGASLVEGHMTICLAGDGSIMMNLQELQTIIHYNLPIKIFLLDNGGYSSIKQTQSNFFGGGLIGCDNSSGISFPDFVKLSQAMGFKAFVIDKHENLSKVLIKILSNNTPSFCVVRLIDNYIFSPKLSHRKLADGSLVSAPLEDMFPFMERDEFNSNMLNNE